MFKKLMLVVVGFLATAGFAFAAVDFNTADKAALDGVKGIGPVTADKIIAARKAGKFADWNDMIKRVDGIGPNNAADMSGSGATVDGKSFKGVAPKAADKAAKDKPAAAKGKDEKPVAKDAAKSDKPTKADDKAAKPTKAEMNAEKAAKAKAEKAEKTMAKKADAPSKDAANKDAPTKDAAKSEKPKQ